MENIMTEVMALCSALQIHFGDWNLSRIKCLSQMVLAIMMVKTINLVQVSTAFKGETQQLSNYKRINRFMCGFSFSFDSVAKFVASTFPFNDTWYIAIDRTNWKFGKKDINVFVLSICHRGIGIPLIWKTLDKRANTNTADRIELLKRFINLFGAKKITTLLADREFIGKEWIQFLLKEKIPFTIRIKCNFNIPDSRGKLKPAKTFFRNLMPGNVRYLGQRKVLGCLVYVIGEKLLNGEYRIVVTDSKPEKALDRYNIRQEIETMFGCLKTRGFNFEDTHMTMPKRIDNLLAVMTIAFVWSYRAGDIFNDIKPIAIKSHGARAKSIFRYGYDYLRRLLINFCDRTTEFFRNLEVIKAGEKQHEALKNMMRA
jgi:hypothetical protein